MEEAEIFIYFLKHLFLSTCITKIVFHSTSVMIYKKNLKGVQILLKPHMNIPKTTLATQFIYLFIYEQNPLYGRGTHYPPYPAQKSTQGMA